MGGSPTFRAAYPMRVEVAKSLWNFPAIVMLSYRRDTLEWAMDRIGLPTRGFSVLVNLHPV